MISYNAKVPAKRRNRLLAAALTAMAFLSAGPAYAWNYESQSATTTHSVQIRAGAEFSKKWHNGLRLGFSEDLRSDIYNSATGAAFRTSFTTIGLGYAPVEYVRFDIGYTLKYSHKDTTDVNELLRHRGFASVTGSYKTRYFKLSLRERVLMEARTDSINPLEKSRYQWQLRSKIGAEAYIPGKPVKPYLWCEVINTLNAPEYQQKNGHQFVSQVRTQAGVKWRLTKLSSLDFYYRFTYGYDRDINITKKKGYIKLTEETLFQHAVGVTYHLDW